MTAAYDWKPQNCPICNRPPGRRLGRRGGEAHGGGLGVACEVWQCGGCSLIFPHPMPVPRGGLGQHYAAPPDEYFRNHNPAEKMAQSRQKLAAARGILGGPGRLLDIGCGRGELLKAAREEGWDATGIEPTAAFADYAASFSGCPILRAPVDECDLPAGSYDAVILAAVLEHLYDPDTVLAAISRALRSGGILFVDVPNEAGLHFRLGNLYQRLRGRDWVVNLAPTWEPYHTFGFTPRALRSLLAKHGLTPAVWRNYPGTFIPGEGHSRLERLAGRAVPLLARGPLGTYIEVWARKE